MIKIPCCYFPTNLLIVDDDQDLLKSIRLFFEEDYKTTCVSDLKKASAIISENNDWINKLLEVSRFYDPLETARFSVEMDLSLLHKQVYNPKRFNHVAILIVDYDMPAMNGLDFIRSLGDHQLKIIMLTGKATPETVIKAFNNKEIHRYVSKGEPDYLQTTAKYIKELHREFFMDFSKFLLDSLKTETKIFQDEDFKNIFEKTVDENHIVEFYLLDESGSFLMLDAKVENQIWLIIKSEEEMRVLYELATGDKDVPTHVIKKLKNRETLTHFKPGESNLEAKYWNLVDARPLNEKKEFYYSFLKNNEDFEVDSSKIKSYADFLNENAKS